MEAKPKEELDTLMTNVKSIGYYAGTIFGTGYSLIFLGVIFIFVETVIGLLQLSQLSSYFGRLSPWRIATLVLLLIGDVFGIGVGASISGNARAVKDNALTIEKVSSTVSSFSLMLLFLWLGVVMRNFADHVSPVYSIFGVAGAIMLLVGFERYQSKETRLVGTILMLISIMLIYFVAYSNIRYRPYNGLLFSELTIEVASFIVVMVCAIIFSFPVAEEKVTKTVIEMVFSIMSIIFLVGVIHICFSALPLFSMSMPPARIPYLVNIPGYYDLASMIPDQAVYSSLLVFVGFILLGTSGIIGIVTSSLMIAASINLLVSRPKVSEVPPPPPPP
ncbi:MAG: hypothetical protein ACUVQ0_05115 [Thermoproteota archaeon]